MTGEPNYDVYNLVGDATLNQNYWFQGQNFGTQGQYSAGGGQNQVGQWQYQQATPQVAQGQYQQTGQYALGQTGLAQNQQAQFQQNSQLVQGQTGQATNTQAGNGYGASWMTNQTGNQTITAIPNQRDVSPTIVKPILEQFSYNQGGSATTQQAALPQNAPYQQQTAVAPSTNITAQNQNVQAAFEAERLASLAFAAGQHSQKTDEEVMRLQLMIENLNQKISLMSEEQKRLYAQGQINHQVQVTAPQPTQVTPVQPAQGVTMVTGLTGANLTGFQMVGDLPVTGKMDAYGRQEVNGQVQAVGTLQLTGFIDTKGSMDTQGTLHTQGQVQAVPQTQAFQVQLPTPQYQVIPTAPVSLPQVQPDHLQNWMQMHAFQDKPVQNHFADTFNNTARFQQSSSPLLAGGLRDSNYIHQTPAAPEPVTGGHNTHNVDELVEIMKSMSKKIEGIEQNINKPQKSQKNVSFRDGPIVQDNNIDDQSFTTSLQNNIANYTAMTTAQSFNDSKSNTSNQNNTFQDQQRTNKYQGDNQPAPQRRDNSVSNREYRPERDVSEPRRDYSDRYTKTTPSYAAPIETRRVQTYTPSRPIVTREEPIYVREEPIVVTPVRPKRVSYVPVERVVTDLVPVVDEEVDYVPRSAIRRQNYFPLQLERDVHEKRTRPTDHYRSQPRLNTRYVDSYASSYRSSIFRDRGSTYYPSVIGDRVTYGFKRTAQFFNPNTSPLYSFGTGNNWASFTPKDGGLSSMNTTIGSNSTPNTPLEVDIAKAIRDKVSGEKSLPPILLPATNPSSQGIQGGQIPVPLPASNFNGK